jgi:cell wall assembly regulator SMI1
MKRQIEDRFAELGGILTFHPPMTEEELAAIEGSLGGRLPEDFRDFMRAYGEAAFQADTWFRPARSSSLSPTPFRESPVYEELPFSHFYGSSAGKQSLARRITLCEGRMPDTIIPIGDDGFGNQICLGIKGNERGKVYYWDHENTWSEQRYREHFRRPMPLEYKFQNVYLVAESFADFIARLEVRSELRP